jgi:hypothetical protein
MIHLLHLADPLVVFPLGFAEKFRNIDAGRKGLSLSPDDNNPDFLGIFKLDQRLVQFMGKLGAERIQLFRPIQADDADMSVLVYQD